MGPATLAAAELVDRRGLVERQRLLRRLHDARDAAVVVIVAPAGYGKTTLLDQWAAVEERPVARVRIDPVDDEPVRLLGRLLDALDGVQRVDAELRAAMEVPAPDLAGHILPLFADALAEERPGMMLAVDDLHLLSSPEALSVVETLVRHVPPGTVLALASRVTPRVPLARQRVSRRVLEFDAADLAMDERESVLLLARAGLEVDEGDARRLWERTEGWAAGLYLAALALRDRPQRAAQLFAGGYAEVADYLTEEFLAGAPDREVEFLTDCAILDELDGPRCDAILGRDDSSALLAEIARGNLLVAPLDGPGRRYRCHSLLREMLTDRLRERGAHAERRLHHRASAWYLEQGDLDRAADHAVAGHDADEAGDLLWAHIPYFVSQGRNGMTRRWLATFSDETMSRSPSLSLTAACCHLTEGTLPETERWEIAGSRALAAGPERPLQSLLAAGALVMRAAVSRGGLEQTRADARRAYDADPGYWRTMASLLSGAAAHLAGDVVEAREWLEEGVHLASVLTPNVEALCLAQLMLMDLDEQDLDGAEWRMRRARDRLDEYRIGEYPTCAAVHGAIALVQIRLGRCDTAAAHARQAERLLRGLRDFIVWHVAQTEVVLAQVHLGLANHERARRLIGDAARTTRRVRGEQTLSRWIGETWRDLDDRADEALRGTAGLTMAELRILRFLPTHHSFREIGLRLHVSTNTVKTHARAIYRKLDVTSRSEAVVRARQLGLLD